MMRFYTVVIAFLAVVFLTGSTGLPQQKFISKVALDYDQLKTIETIAILEIPDPPYYFFGEGFGALSGLFGLIGALGEMSNFGKKTAEYGEFSFGKIAQSYLKEFLEENGYTVVEHSVSRKNKYGLIKDYSKLNIPGVDAYLDVAPVEVGYKQNDLNPFNNKRNGPHVSSVARLVSATTNKVIYAEPVQYGWEMNPVVSGIKIDSPEDHKYESQEELKANKEEAIARLERGIEAVTLNIAKQITKGRFVSVMSPTLEDVMGDDGDAAPFEYVGIAATEIASQTYDKKLWYQAGKLAKGDTEKRSGIYIKLRSKQLLDKKKQEEAEKIAKLTNEGDSESTQVYNLTGTYRSSITSNSSYVLGKRRYKKLTFEIKQDGDKISGKSLEEDIEINGILNDGTVKFEVDPAHATGNWQVKGTWKIKEDGMRLIGRWSQPKLEVRGKWKMERIR